MTIGLTRVCPMIKNRVRPQNVIVHAVFFVHTVFLCRLCSYAGRVRMPAVLSFRPCLGLSLSLSTTFPVHYFAGVPVSVACLENLNLPCFLSPCVRKQTLRGPTR